MSLEEVKKSRPDWLRVKAPTSKEYHNTYDLIRRHKLNTV
ncbi:MAG: lipoyl synthase, partial [Alphaproteobacteria bacterium]